MLDWYNLIQIMASIWGIFENSVIPYITVMLTEISNRYFTFRERKYIIKVASKCSESRIVIDKNKSHEHLEIDLKR